MKKGDVSQETQGAVDDGDSGVDDGSGKKNKELSRRDFLKTAGALGMAAALGGVHEKLFTTEAGAATASPLAVTVLGSGGPMAMVDRASPGYLLSVDGTPRVFMDCGGGTYERLGQGRILNLERVDMWLFSHFHIDHCADFPAIIKSMYYLRRAYNPTPLTIIGPDRGGKFPSAVEFVDKNFNPETGVYAYLHDFLNTVYSPDIRLTTMNVPYDYTVYKSPITAFEKDGIRVSTIPVRHGSDLATPSVAYRVDYSGKSITFSGDLSSDAGLDRENIVALSTGSDVLIYDASLSPAQQFDPPDDYHTLPGEIGQVAQAAGVRKLVLSHFMPPYTDLKIREIVAAVKQYYSGTVIVASDLLAVDTE